MSNPDSLPTEADKFHDYCVASLQFLDAQNKILEAKIAELLAKRKANEDRAQALVTVKNRCYLLVNSWLSPDDMSL